MAFYDYLCTKCKKEFEIQKSIADYQRHEKCPKCGQLCNRFFENDKQLVRDGVPRTLGALADKNGDKKR